MKILGHQDISGKSLNLLEAILHHCSEQFLYPIPSPMNSEPPGQLHSEVTLWHPSYLSAKQFLIAKWSILVLHLKA